MPEIPLNFFALVVLSLILLTRWLWDYNRARREADLQHEPKVVPALHLTYATKSEHGALAIRLDEELARERSARTKVHDDIAALQALTAALRAETTAQTNTLNELKQDQREIRARIDDLPRRTAEAFRAFSA
jgi:hypothetical protein